MFGNPSGFWIYGFGAARASRSVWDAALRRTVWTVAVAALITAVVAMAGDSPVMLPVAGEVIISGAGGGGSKGV